jgi:hypothetical protein
MTYIRTYNTNGPTQHSSEIHCLKCWWTGPASACKIRIKKSKPGTFLAQHGRHLKHYHCPRCDALVKATYITNTDPPA